MLGFETREEEAGLILVVDDDETVLRSIGRLLESAGLSTILATSALPFVEGDVAPEINCIVMDVRLPRMSGLDVQAVLARRGDERPVIFITGYGDVPMTVRAMKAGAIDFLQKPFRDQDLLDAVANAIRKDRRRRVRRAVEQSIHERASSLTPREGQIMSLLADGLLNKQVAGELGLSEMTVKLHRTSILRKMQVRNVVELVRMVGVLEREAR